MSGPTRKISGRAENFRVGPKLTKLARNSVLPNKHSSISPIRYPRNRPNLNLIPLKYLGLSVDQCPGLGLFFQIVEMPRISSIIQDFLKKAGCGLSFTYPDEWGTQKLLFSPDDPK